MTGKIDFSSWNKQQKTTRDKLLSKRDAERKKGFKTPMWKYRMKWFRTRELTSAWVRLQPLRKNEPWFTWHSKWVQIGEKNGKPVRRQIIANSRNGELPVPCVLYFYASQDENPDLLATEQSAISLVDLNDYHKIPRKGKNNSTYYIYERCKGKGRYGRTNCEMCAEDVEKVFGQQFYWSMYPTAHRDFESQIDSLKNRCGNCKTGVLHTYAYKCAKCDHSFGNHYEQEIPSEVEDTLKNREVTCDKCDHTAMAVQVHECNHQHGRGDEITFSEGCDNPQVMDIDFDIWKMDIKVVFETVGKTQTVKIVDFREGDELAEELARPLDLDQFLGKMDLDEQADQMNRDNPFDAAAQKILDEYVPLPPESEDFDSIPYDSE